MATTLNTLTLELTGANETKAATDTTAAEWTLTLKPTGTANTLVPKNGQPLVFTTTDAPTIAALVPGATYTLALATTP